MMSADRIAREVGQALVDDNLLTVDALAAATEASILRGVNLVELLVAEGSVRQVDALRKIGGLAGVEFHDPASGIAPDPAALRSLDPEMAVAESALPLRKGKRGVVVAVADPFDRDLQARLEVAIGEPVVLALAPRESLGEAVQKAYRDFADISRGPSVIGMPRDKQPSSEPAGRTDADHDYHINDLLEKLVDLGGSDLHLTVGSPPRVRVHGELRDLEGYAPLLPGPLRNMVYGILTSRQREELENGLELDASHPLPGKARFRVNVFFQRGAVGTVMRAIPSEIKGLAELGMPAAVRDFASLPRGLVLVTGATGSGKSTTLAALVDLINATRSVHIMTIEDPIEFIHDHKKAIVNQREVGADTGSFANALRHALRQDPDVILLGEMRDLETISTALTAAETGHLVLATLHTQDAPGTVERVIDVFPPHQQQQVRVQLAEALRGVVSQQLLPTSDGRGRVAAVEVMVVTPAVSNLIREGKVHQIRSVIQSGARHGMQSMDASLANLVRAGRIDRALATDRAHSVDEFNNLLGGGIK